jgi:hypothetical protein
MSSRDDGRNGNDHPKEVNFTIDGRPFTVQDPHQTAAALLQLAGLDTANYDLAELRQGEADPKLYRDDANVHVKDGDRFITVRQRAEVA